MKKNKLNVTTLEELLYLFEYKEKIAIVWNWRDILNLESNRKIIDGFIYNKHRLLLRSNKWLGTSDPSEKKRLQVVIDDKMKKIRSELNCYGIYLNYWDFF